MKKFVYGVVLYLSSFVGVADAFIYEACVMRKWDPLHQHYHYFIGCSDFHDKDHEATTEQRGIIEQSIFQCDLQKTKVIVEDLSSPGFNGRCSCGRYCLGPKGGILSGLGRHFKMHGVDVENVEYRFCRVVALGPVMERIRNDAVTCDNKLCSTCDTTVKMLLQEMADISDEIRLYNDGSILNAYYAQCIRDIESKCKELHLGPYQGLSVANYLERHITEDQRLNQLKHLLTFDSALLDAKMIHVVVNTMHKEKIVAIAGGTHINALCTLLKKLGYETVYQVASAKNHDAGIQNCLGSNPQSQYDGKPQAVDISFLANYL